MYRNGPEWASITGMDRHSKECTVIDRNGINNRNGQFLPFKCRVKPGFIGRQGSSDRSLYVSYTALPTDTSLVLKKLSIRFGYQSSVWYCSNNLHSACHNAVFSLDKTQLRKNTPCFKGSFTKWRRKKHRDSSPVYFNILSKGFYTKFVTEIVFLHERNIRWR